MNSLYRLVIHLESESRAKEVFNAFICDNTDLTLEISTDKKESEALLKENQEEIRIHRYSIITDLIQEKDRMLNKKDKVISQYMGHGIIRLFKESDTSQNSVDDNEDMQGNPTATLTVPGDDTMLCILFVPTYFTVHDLLHFYIGDDIVHNQISNFRILQNHDAGVGFNFTVLMKFKDPIGARRFKETFNGKKFSKIDPERCHVVFIKELTFKANLFDNNEELVPYLLTDPFTRLNEDNMDKGQSVELPMCPVCLERMDAETTGLITIPCQHTFHCHCLDAWKNSKCPVCRYSSFRLTRNSLIQKAGDSPKCTICGDKSNLWICLICGNIGCGRYNSKHAIQHFESTSHCFAMDMKTQRVWDYAGDNYVHRIVQNEVDGKLVEVSGNFPNVIFENNNMAGGSGGGGIVANSNSGNCQQNENANTSGKCLDLAENFLRNKEYHLEYVQVLISQLESQREYYEEKIERLQEKSLQDSHIWNEQKHLEERYEKLESSFLELQAEFRKIELENKKLKTTNETKLNNYQKESSEKDQIIKGMSRNLDNQVKKYDRLKELNNELLDKNKNLEEEVKDLMFYINARDKFEGATEEEINGTVVVQHSTKNFNTDVKETVNISSSKNKKKNKKKKRKNKNNSITKTELTLSSDVDSSRCLIQD